ncbi:MAG: efflux RND transporter periplasmic adaptor subunit [Cryomorphaceae bacterium]|nr:efflux RND transporter periplasmic adaptor subunit [Cryomorphaceae bacterium]
MKTTNVLILFALILLSACSSNHGNGAESEPLTIDYLPLKERIFNSDLRLNGSLLPNEETTMRSEVNGRVWKIDFEEGNFIKKGQRLVQLDVRDLLAEKEKTEVLFNQAKTDRERRTPLLKSKAISQEEFDQFQNRELELKATLNQLEARIDQYKITAPFDGIVGLRNVSVGSMVSPGEMIGTLVMTHPLKVEFAVPEQYAQLVSVGDTIYFSLRNSEDTLSARVFATDGRISPTTRSLRVRAIYENPDHKLIPGAYVRVIYPLEVKKDAILIPTDAVVSQSDGEWVMRIINGKAQPTKVQTGERTADEVLIRRGLSANDTIALTGLLYLREGMPVTLEQK